MKFMPSDIYRVMNDIFVAVKTTTKDEKTIVRLDIDNETPAGNLKLVIITLDKMIPFFIEDFNLFVNSHALLDYCIERIERELGNLMLDKYG